MTGLLETIVPAAAQFPFGLNNIRSVSHDLGSALVESYAFTRVAVLNTETGAADFLDGGLNGEAPNGGSLGGDLSSDGRFAVFSSFASNLVEHDLNSVADIFLFDTQARSLGRVSRGLAGTEPDDRSEWPALSDEGRFVAYASLATNLAQGDVNGSRDVFLWDAVSHETVLVSRNASGTPGGGDSFGPRLSASGNLVFFTSSAQDLVPDDSNGVADVFVFERSLGIVERISVSAHGQQANRASTLIAISSDGRYALVGSEASNLVSGDDNGRWDLFLIDVPTLVTR